MNEERRDLEHRRDHALRDLVELDRQVRDGELSLDVETQLRRAYEHEAATAITELDRLTKPEDHNSAEDPTLADRIPRGRLHPRWVLYGLGTLALASAGILLPNYILDRPDGGFVTGNEALQQPAEADDGTSSRPPTAGRDLTKVTDQELEAVVEANPEVTGMRLALADRYNEKGRYDLAVVHYGKVLEEEPDNAEAQAGLGWLMLQLNEPVEAARLVDGALATDALSPEALWVKANIRLYGFDDAEGALEVLDTMSGLRDLSSEVRGQLEELRRVAAQQVASGSK